MDLLGCQTKKIICPKVLVEKPFLIRLKVASKLTRLKDSNKTT